jgi:diguanylate cyclase (GGDEF)-like protein
MPTPIIEKILAADNLPSLPSAAIQVLHMTQAEDVSLADIARVIQQDPAMTVKILKVVNSSLFGLPRRVSSVQQAMVVMGMRTVKVMVLSFSLVDSLSDRRTGDFDYTGYWRRSLTTAAMARTLAERTCPRSADEAFVSGLLCDIGMLASYHWARELYLPVLAAHEKLGGPIQDAERAVLGVTHESIATSLLNHWGLPASLCQSVATHHSPVADPSASDTVNGPLTRTLRAAAMIADLFCASTQAGSLADCKLRIVRDLPLQKTALNEALEALDAHVNETASLFSLEIGPTRSYRDLQADAMLQLARLGMDAEMERIQIARREQAVLQEVEQLNTQNRELAYRVVTDGLTGVGNRTALEDRLAAECEKARARKTPLGLILLDLDRFKGLNDNFGHQIGDEALRMVGACLRKFASQNRFAARYGGEEFALIVTGCSVGQFRALAEDLRAGIQALSIPFGQRRISITASLGAAYLEPNDPDLNPRAITRRADECLYEAKHAGRNRIVYTSTRKSHAREKTCECVTAGI